MIDHVSIGVANLELASNFYEQVLKPIGLEKLVEKPGTVGFGKRYPEFWLNLREDKLPDPNAGMHVCLRARTTSAVQAFFELAVAHGASPQGEPDFRPQYSATYYAAFIRDRDGNIIEVLTFGDDTPA